MKDQKRFASGDCRRLDANRSTSISVEFTQKCALAITLGASPAESTGRQPAFDAAGRWSLHRLQTPSGRALYGLRKQTVEPVFGIIKHAMRFRQFLLRGKRKVSGEWQLVTLSYNLRRMANLAAVT